MRHLLGGRLTWLTQKRAILRGCSERGCELTLRTSHGYRRVYGRSSAGERYGYWIREMPPIPPELLDAVVYLYPDKAAAEAGEQIGGSGFLASVLNGPAMSYYIVTNQHVALKAGAARLTRRGNVRLMARDPETAEVDVIETPRPGWVDHSDGDDVSVFPVSLERQNFRHASIAMHFFANEFTVLGPGDDIFFLGRFTTLDGKQRNSPIVRFGHLATMPQMIDTPRGVAQESFVVEALSLKGYSGSPVLIYDVHSESLFGGGERKRMSAPRSGGRTSAGPLLLGIDWGHLRHKPEPVREKGGDPVQEGWYVQQNSGMAGVVPAWKITQLLASEELVEMRKKEAVERQENAEGELDIDEGGDEFERAEDLTRKLLKVPKKELDEKRREQDG